MSFPSFLSYYEDFKQVLRLQSLKYKNNYFINLSYIRSLYLYILI
ncbi:hypothetical protein OZD61_05775 [Wolbachia endosymbiont of Drosophila bocki]|nr:hypothetical protein [Wolbachia endosymbiont of Drosophila bocki]